MFRFSRVSTFLGISLILTACLPARSGTGVQTPQVDMTAVIETVEPETALPPDYPPPPTPIQPTQTPIPTLPGAPGPTELKYRVLSEFPDFFFCDPDYYPVSRDDELALALERFAEIQANAEEFGAILAHNNLAGQSEFTGEQKLLIYREHKRLSALFFELAGDAYRFQLQAAEIEGEGELVTGTIDGRGSITILERTPSIATCPICLAAGTLIDTPDGSLTVESLRRGMLVWTLDSEEERVARPLVEVGKTVVPASHRVVHLQLEDGRQLWVSPGHLTADGRSAGQLKAGDSLDGSRILSTQRSPYAGAATYDLLPAGETGVYWANGVLLASSLKIKMDDNTGR